MKSKIKHDYTCDKCGKPATYNIQTQWHKYSISEDGNFDERDSWEGDENEFYCDKCIDLD